MAKRRRIRPSDERVAIAVADLVRDAGTALLPRQIAPFLTAGVPMSAPMSESPVNTSCTVLKQRLATSFLYVSRFLALARQHPRRAARMASRLPPRHCPCGCGSLFAECCQVPLSMLLRAGGAQDIWPNILMSASTRVRAALSMIDTVPRRSILTTAYALCLQDRYREAIQILGPMTSEDHDLNSAEAHFACTLLWMSYERLGDVGGHLKLATRLLRTQLRPLKAEGWMGLARLFWSHGDMHRFHQAHRRGLAEDPPMCKSTRSNGNRQSDSITTP
jgi:hypothetical protein